MKKQKDIASGRRRFLQRSLALIPLVSAGSALLRTSEAVAAAAPRLRADAPLFFTADEWRFLCAACRRLIPDDELGPGAVAEGVPAFIDKQMELPYGYGQLWYMQPPFADGVPELGYQSALVPRQVYRLGIAAVDVYCRQFFQAAFADLYATQQDEVLQALESGRLQFDMLPGPLFFEQLLENTREGYFSDPIHGGNQSMASWRLIGFPGARADYPWVMDHPNQGYPLPPVDISGKRGVKA